MKNYSFNFNSHLNRFVSELPYIRVQNSIIHDVLVASIQPKISTVFLLSVFQTDCYHPGCGLNQFFLIGQRSKEIFPVNVKLIDWSFTTNVLKDQFNVKTELFNVMHRRR